jgi:hypothetical protein
VPAMTVGRLAMNDVSTLAIPLDLGYARLGGILGFDFFAGHVVHIDYTHERVEVLTPEAAASAFRDPKTIVIPADFDEGVPLVHGAFGAAGGDRFALDTGSPHLFVLAPFERRHQKAIDALWTPVTFGGGRRTEIEGYLEGSIVVSARRVSGFALGPVRYPDLVVGLEEPNARPSAIDIALDGIVGTDQMIALEWWYDYDGGRIAVRRNGAR